jgi:hypothetical protein
MKKIGNRCKVFIATIGTGAVTFGTATSGAFYVPADGGYASGDVVAYTLTEGTDVEQGFGTIGTSALTMTRDTVRRSKIAGVVGTTKMTLAGGAILIITPAAEDLMFSDTHGTDIASAATLNLETATGQYVHVTGTTGITAVTLLEGHTRWVQFTGILTITVGASLIGNAGGSNITTAVGDFAEFTGDASGVVYFTLYRASGAAVSAPAIAAGSDIATGTDNAKMVTAAGLASAGVNIPTRTLLATLTASSSAFISDTTHLTSAYKKYELEFIYLRPANDNVAFNLQFSQDGGSTWKTAGYYVNSVSNPISAITLATSVHNTFGYGLNGSIFTGDPTTTTKHKTVGGHLSWFSTPAGCCQPDRMVMGFSFGSYNSDTAAINGVRIITTSGNIADGVVKLWGYP